LRAARVLLASALTALTAPYVLAADDFDPSLIAVTPAYAFGDLANAFDYSRVRADARYLAELSSRVTGTPGNAAAREFLMRRLAEAGVSGVATEEFPALAPVVDDESTPAALALEGEQIRLEPLWPNLVRPSRAPRAGITGPLVYVGGGDLTSYDRKPVKGSIAVMEFNSGRAWYGAAMVGAAAVVFLEPPETIRGEAEQKFSEQPLSTPRFIAMGSGAAALRKATADGATPTGTVTGGSRWQEVTGVNIHGFIAGSDPDLAAEPIVLTAWYDSMSVAPTVAPGAEGAANCAFLVELCRILHDYPPRRPVIVLLTDAHGLAMAGMRDFVQRRVTAWRPEKAKAADARQLEPLHFRGMIGVDLTSHGTAVGAFYKGFFYNYIESARFKFSDFGTACRDYGWLLSQEFGVDRDQTVVDCINTGTDRSWGTYLPCAPCLEAECATLAGYAGTSLVSTGDMRALVDTPLDTFGRLDHANLERQMRLVACTVPNLLCEVLQDAAVGLFKADPDDGFAKLHGGVFEFGKSISFFPQDPVPGAIALWARVTKTLCGVRHHIMDQVGEDGRYELVGLPLQTHNWGAATELAAFLVDDDTGDVIYAPDRGAQGAKRITFDNFTIDAVDQGKDVVVFRAEQISIIDTIDPAHFGILSDVRVLDRATKAVPFQWGLVRPSWTDARIPGDPEPAAVVYGAPGEHLILLMKPGFEAPRMLLLGATPSEPLGEGISVDDERVIANLAYRSASDMWILDESRIARFAKFGVSDTRSTRLHALSRGTLDEAKQAQEAGDISKYVALARRALAVEDRVYPAVQRTARDVVNGVIFYLVLLIPFAYLVERLLFAGRTIHKQVLGAVGVFFAVFIVLAAVHPAFRVTATPLIVLLAFILMVLAGLVAVLLLRHFDQQMADYRHQTIGQHEADVARLSSATAAFALGVGNMRRRPTRTGLTCVTLVLLTFTVVSFTSVKTEQRVRRVKRDNPPAYTGILIRQPTYGPFSEYTYSVLRNDSAGRFPIVPRSWTLSEGSALKSSVPLRYGSELYDVGALLGMVPEEPKVTRIADTLVGAKSRWFTDSPDDLATCILPTRVAQAIGFGEDQVGTDTIQIRGVPLKVIGLYDGDAADELRDLDGEMMTPIDEVEQNNLQRRGELMRTTTQNVELGTTTADTPHIPAGNVVLVNYAMSLRLGGSLRCVAAGLEGDEDAEKTQMDLVSRLDFGVFSGFGGTTYFCSAVGRPTFAGLEGTIIPILIAALIVLNTMLGSVYERVKEIAIFSSVGLAPAHVGFLFLSEASVYAVIGAIVGYLIGQTIAWLYVHLHWFQGLLSLNYSSMAAVGSTVIIMSVVFVSTLYPAKKAAELAVAGVERRWRLPEPEGDVLTVDLPFTMHTEETLGLLAYLAEYLNAHADYSVGEFSTDGATLMRSAHAVEAAPRFTLRFRAWLSPYDVGVSEECEIRIVPTDEPDLLGAVARVYRVSGDDSAWIRCTRAFLHLLRRQFLLWRTFSPTEKVKYHRTGEEVAIVG